MSWIEAHERGKETVEMLLRKFQEMTVLLEIPSGTEVWKAGGDAGRNGFEALKSIFHFLILVGRPFVLATGWTLFTVGSLIWEHVLVNGIYKHGLSQSREAAVAFWKFQTSLSQKELMIEAAICAVLVALYFLRRWLQRNRYIQRASLVAKRQMRMASRVGSLCVVCLFLFSLCIGKTVSPWSSVVHGIAFLIYRYFQNFEKLRKIDSDRV